MGKFSQHSTPCRKLKKEEKELFATQFDWLENFRERQRLNYDSQGDEGKNMMNGKKSRKFFSRNEIFKT